MSVNNLLMASAQMFPPKAKWSVEQIPDLNGKVVLVTGGNTGIGKETVKNLLTHNAKVYLATRDEQRARKCIEELKEQTGGNEALFIKLDLADLRSVRKAADEFLEKEAELHILFENAAVMGPPTTMFTEQNYDLQFGTNVLGHFHLRTHLLPALLRASTPEHKSRIVITSSSAAYIANEIKWTTLKKAEEGEKAKKQVKERKKIDPMGLYYQSKFANVVVAAELARRYGDKLVVTSLNPGNINTELSRYAPKVQQRFMAATILYSPALGALTQLWAGTAPECAGYNGKFLIPWARLGSPNPYTQDPKTAEKLWAWLEEACVGF